MANSRIYFKSEAGGTTVVSRDTTATSGNLVLPASGNVASVDTAVTDNAIARYDGTTGKLQNSSVTIDDNGNIGTGTQTFNGFGGSGFKNYIINGNFDIAQRGGTHTLVAVAAGVYHLDRWCSTQFGYGGTQSVQKISATVNGANDVALRTSQVTACNNKIVQILDNDSSKALRGKKMTVSFWYRAKGNISCRLQQRTDQQTLSSDFTTALTENIGTDIGVSSGLIADETWRYASFTTSTSNANGYFHLVFNQDIAVGNYYEISRVQLEEGSIATPFENRPSGLELSLCQRYYERIGNDRTSSIYHDGYSVTGGLIGTTISFKATKRVQPTVTKVGTWGVTNCNQPVVGGFGVDCVQIRASITSAGGGSFSSTTSAYIEASAEL